MEFKLEKNNRQQVTITLKQNVIRECDIIAKEYKFSRSFVINELLAQGTKEFNKEELNSEEKNNIKKIKKELNEENKK